MKIDFSAIEKLFQRVGEGALLEHDVYALMDALGIDPPVHFFCAAGESLSERDLSALPGSRVVVKVVSRDIAHKSDVGGVRFVAKEAAAVNRAAADMLIQVPQCFAAWAARYAPDDKTAQVQDIRSRIQGFLVLEAVESMNQGFGSELLVGLRNSREFGPVISMGGGGLDVEFLHAHLKTGRAVSITAAHLEEEFDISPRFRTMAFFEKLTSSFRGRPPLVAPELLAEIHAKFQRLGAHFSPYSERSDFVIEEAEVNPFVVRAGRLVPLDGLCRIARRIAPPPPRPFTGIEYLLEPRSIAVIGVSEKMNLGRIILKNILKQGFPRDRVYVVKPGTAEIEGCSCVAGPADLPEVVDLFVLTIAAEQGLGVINQLIDAEKARSMIIIAGGVGEKEGTQSIEADIKSLLQASRRSGRLTPVVNGGNCLGIFSRPGRYDTTFVPEHKIFSLPREDIRSYPLAYISQSGAYMISRMSQLAGIVPAYAVSIGNQIDLTISDYLHYLQDHDEARIVALYIEGFQPGDGLALARAAQAITRQPGKAVVAYKAGRTPEGREATASHTASVAGDYAVSRAVLEQAGVFVADTIDEFESMVKALCFLSNKIVRGARVGLISNAGFECVIMSDSLTGESALELARFSPSTTRRIAEILDPLGITRLQDVRNPMDVTPVADDGAFGACVEAILGDKNIDCAVVSPLPMSPAMNTLAPAPDHGEDLMRRGSTPRRLVEIFRRSDKPFVVSIDSGEPYRAMKQLMEKEGVPVFRRCDEAVKFLGRFVRHILRQRSAEGGNR
jgi:acyl-CoA synthetase (NDP forming)